MSSFSTHRPSHAVSFESIDDFFPLAARESHSTAPAIDPQPTRPSIFEVLPAPHESAVNNTTYSRLFANLAPSPPSGNVRSTTKLGPFDTHGLASSPVSHPCVVDTYIFDASNAVPYITTDTTTTPSTALAPAQPRLLVSKASDIPVPVYRPQAGLLASALARRTDLRAPGAICAGQLAAAVAHAALAVAQVLTPEKELTMESRPSDVQMKAKTGGFSSAKRVLADTSSSGSDSDSDGGASTLRRPTRRRVDGAKDASLRGFLSRADKSVSAWESASNIASTVPTTAASRRLLEWLLQQDADESNRAGNHGTHLDVAPAEGRVAGEGEMALHDLMNLCFTAAMTASADGSAERYAHLRQSVPRLLAELFQDKALNDVNIRDHFSSRASPDELVTASSQSDNVNAPDVFPVCIEASPSRKHVIIGLSDGNIRVVGLQ